MFDFSGQLHVLNMTLMVPHTLYGIGIYWSPLPYMEQVLYGPHRYVWSPTCEVVFMSYMTYGPLAYDSYGPPYLIWNWHLMAPHRA